jgi:hypothetical protein
MNYFIHPTKQSTFYHSIQDHPIMINHPIQNIFHSTNKTLLQWMTTRVERYGTDTVRL